MTLSRIVCRFWRLSLRWAAGLTFAVRVLGIVSGSPSGAVATARGALPLGSVSPAGAPPDCPVGTTCLGLTVTCPGVEQSVVAHLATNEPTGRRRGLVMFFSAGGGESWYLGQAQTTALVSELQADGFKVVQVRWETSWLTAARGEQAGAARLACRPATVIRWVYDNVYSSMGVRPSTVGRCGFCASGNSGGATQVAYSLGYYGLDSILDAVVPTSGPPHAAIAKGCLEQAGYDYENDLNIDRNYGFLGRAGPWGRHELTWASQWDADSIAVGALDLVHPTTRIELMVGDLDETGSPAHSAAYRDSLVGAGSPLVRYLEVVCAGHTLPDHPSGRAATRAALLGDPGR
ncbi:hypothetical protein BH18ACT4_BH18ACT4_14310 [soil metagenome]